MKLGGFGGAWQTLSACCAVGLAVVSCGDEFEPVTPTGAGATGGSGPQGGSGAEGGSGAMGGAGGAGGGPQCQPSDEEACYDGESATENVGICHGGTRYCQPNGRFGPCEDQQLPEEEDCTAEPDEDCDGFSCSEHIWSGMYGHTGTSGTQKVLGVGVDSVGNVTITGTYTEAVSFDGSTWQSSAGAGDAFVASFDRDGDPRWSRTFGDAGADIGHALAIGAADDVWVVGEFHGTLPGINIPCPALVATGTSGGFVMHLNGADGSCIDRFQLATNVTATGSKIPLAVAIGPLHHVFVAGYWTGSWSSTGSVATGLAAFVRIYDPDGNVQSGGGSYNSPGDQVATAIAVNPSGEVFLGGYFTDRILLSTSPIMAVPTSAQNAFITKRSSSGQPDWGWTLGHTNTETQSINGLALDGAGRVIAVGDFEGDIRFANGQLKSSVGGADAFAVQYAGDATGAYLWAETQSGGAGHSAVASAVAVDGDDRVALVGTFDGTLDVGGAQHPAVGSGDAFLLKLEPTGDYVWSRTFGSSAGGIGVTATSVAHGSDRVVMGGYTNGAIDFGGGLLTHDDHIFDGFAAVFNP